MVRTKAPHGMRAYVFDSSLFPKSIFPESFIGPLVGQRRPLQPLDLVTGRPCIPSSSSSLPFSCVCSFGKFASWAVAKFLPVPKSLSLAHTATSLSMQWCARSSHWLTFVYTDDCFLIPGPDILSDGTKVAGSKVYWHVCKGPALHWSQATARL